MFDDGSGQSHFVHRTFEEFFVTKFLIEKTIERENQSEEESEAVAELWVNMLKMHALEMVRKFLESKIGKFEITAQKNSSKKVFDVIKKRNSEILLRLASEGCINLVKFVSRQMIERINLVGN